MKTFPSTASKDTWKQRYLRPLVGAALLSAWMLPVLAEGTPAGTTIDNTAYGSFENPADVGTPIPVQSNTVTITVREVAGITMTTPNAPTEAPSGATDPTPGAGQGDGVIGADDVVYFNYRITNTGNNATQFFIPGAPGSVTNGTFDAAAYGPIRVVGYSGATGPVSINVPTNGATTETLSLPGNGSIPIDGYVDIQVPIKVNSSLAAGSQVTVVMGDTPTVGDQNIPYTAGTNDVYTVDNADANDDFPGTPTPEKEASAQQVATIGLASLDYGDAPDTSDGTAQGNYQTVPGRGPSHVVNSTIYLGTDVDSETEAFQDNNGATEEDDGIQLDIGGTLTPIHDASFTAGQTYTLDVSTVGAGNFSAWIDFNRNGSFDDPGEQVFVDRALTAGSTSLDIAVPIGAAGGETYARFRYSTAAGLTSTNAAPDGEVEDYRINLVAANPALKLVKRVTSIGGTAITDVVNDGVANSSDDSLNWGTGYLVGAIGASAEPRQTVEYTIYFLSDGNAPVNNVKICDFVPANTTYVLGSLSLSQGSPSVPLTDDDDGDSGQRFGVGDTPPGPTCDRGTNTDGGILVELPNPVPNATGAGTPADSRGYVRFTVIVD